MFKRLKRFIKRHIHLLLFLFGSVFLLYLLTPNITSSNGLYNHFQTNFSKQELASKQFLSAVKKDWNTSKKATFKRTYFQQKNNFFLHVFKGDSLCFWNTNSFAFSSVIAAKKNDQKAFFSNNGWYYSSVDSTDNFTFVVTFGLQHVYPFENEFLQSGFFEPFDQIDATIRQDFSTGYVVKNNRGKAVFSLHKTSNQTGRSLQSTLIFVCVLFLFLVLWSWTLRQLKSNKQLVFFALFTLILRLIAYKLPFLTTSTGAAIFDVRVFAVNEFIPNLAAFILWIYTAILILITCNKVKIDKINKRFKIGFSVLLLSATICFFPIIAHIIIENSSINLQLNELFQLNFLSIIILLIIGIGGLIFVFIAHKVALFWKANSMNFWRFLLLFSASFFGAFLVLILVYESEVLSLIFSGIFALIILLISFVFSEKWSATSVLITLLFFAIVTAYKLQFEALEKERTTRILYANELSDNRDIATEVEFLSIAKSLQQLSFTRALSFTELKEQLDDNVFTEFWERYAIDCYIFGKNDQELIYGTSRIELDELLQFHSEQSEISPNLFYIKDNAQQLNYLFKIPLTATKDSVLFGTLKSKQLPEEIGFPRLLISDQTNVFESLAAYSFASYYQHRLTNNFGDYNFPLYDHSFLTAKEARGKWLNFEGYSHYIFQRSPDNVVVLSIPNPSFINNITAGAFLMIGYGFLLLVIRVLFFNAIKIYRKNTSLSTKIQFVMVGLVVLSLIGFSVASSSFVTQQYKEYTSDLVLEKARSLSKQLSTHTSNKLFHYGTIDARNYQLQLWSDIYMTDLNYYDVNGGLQGSSRPVIFSKGLLSKNIHPAAFFALKTNKSVAHIQTETIGNLTYLSAYIPLYDHNKSVFGYLNVQHFDQQTLFENQIQQFFIAIINVFMLLLVVSIVGAIAISSWITAPLRMIQKHFNRVAFGKSNQPITYEADDEIGDLLAAYNRKLADLEAAAVLLAQSEREGAWREMAKQVAHEIKNPLTPMKLRIQQLERVFDPTDPDAKQKIQQVTRSIVEQIDSLADIANAFSSFAQFPDPKLEPVSLFELVQGVAQIFESEHVVDFNLTTPSSSIIIDGDSTQLIRVFNNLFANSIQAVDFGKKAIISIDFEQQVGTIIIRIKDNGNGIPDEQLDTIFEPYFTTKSTGTGLGLALVKQLISGHQGTITVETTSESGTTFMLVFPTNQA